MDFIIEGQRSGKELRMLEQAIIAALRGETVLIVGGGYKEAKRRFEEASKRIQFGEPNDSH